jgi:hypothetical protein
MKSSVTSIASATYAMVPVRLVQDQDDVSLGRVALHELRELLANRAERRVAVLLDFGLQILAGALIAPLHVGELVPHLHDLLLRDDRPLAIYLRLKRVDLLLEVFEILDPRIELLLNLILLDPDLLDSLVKLAGVDDGDFAVSGGRRTSGSRCDRRGRLLREPGEGDGRREYCCGSQVVNVHRLLLYCFFSCQLSGVGGQRFRLTTDD